MADYNLHGLNTRDFQHLVQAIARKQIAAGVTAFGDGRDGARDLTYRGKMDYPSHTNAWDGYLVLGCKFNQRPTGDTQKDTNWVLKHLEMDLKKFLNKKRKLSKPEYYILATNISLSGVSETGGRDRATATLQRYSAKLQLKDYCVWDYNDLRGFLDGDTDLRSSYGHFVTAGDVLTQMMEVLKLRKADFAEIMHTFLQKELIADMSAKLQSAGEDPEVQIPLANVFVDLPFAESAEAAVLSNQRGEKFPRVVDALLAAGSSVLRLISDENESAGRETDLPTRKRSRFVIVGGPGQGKSTLGQYLCQLYRAAILRDRPRERLDDQVPRILKQLQNQRHSQGGLPAIRRFPIRVELRSFAHALATDSQLTLLEYIRRDMSHLGGAAISLEDLKSWLAYYPWTLVLDGLDEVPPPSNRTEVLKEIECFRIDAASLNSDILVVATTRPQSYSKEFPDELFAHFYLTPLSPSQALEYGQKLAAARCGVNERRKDELVRSLEKACRNPETSRLMQSPLQVTIMATLLEDTGEPPQQRYRLFLEYYRTIYKRETRRKLLGGILTERQKDIDTIHAQTGLLLQAAGEKSTPSQEATQLNNVDSALSDDQFRELVKRRLQQIAIGPPKISELLDRICDGSLQRLVFLVRPEEGWVRFDITSLKEFMAAEAIMNGSDEDIRERLKVIGPASYWRNVFQFAVGKCFLEREHLLDNLVSLCTGLNEEEACVEILAEENAGRAACAVLWGSRIALDILTDGTARQYPGYEVRFARIALQLVRIADAEISARLASVFHQDLKDLFIQVIDDRLGQTNLRSQMGAWYLLTSLADREIAWALQIIETRWPADTQRQRHILLADRGRKIPSRWFLTKLDDLAPKIAPRELYRCLGPGLGDPQTRDLGAWRRVARFLASGHQCNVANRSSWSALIPRVFVTPLSLSNDLSQLLEGKNCENKEWLPILAAVRFGTNPSARTLAAELQWLAEKCEPDINGWWIPPSPWPIGACLHRVASSRDLLELAQAADQGLLGDIKDWTAAERRWRRHGIVEDDFLATAVDRFPISSELSSVGFPFAISGWSGNDSNMGTQVLRSLERLRKMRHTEARAWLAFALLSLWSHPSRRMDNLSPAHIRELYTIVSEQPAIRRRFFWLNNFRPHLQSGGLGLEWVEFFDWLGCEGIMVSFDEPCFDLAQELSHHFCANPEGHRGLLPIIAQVAVSGYPCVLPPHVLNLARTWGTSARNAALELSFAQANLKDPEIIELANEILRSDSVDVTAWRALKISSVSSPNQSARFALALLSLLRDSTTAEVRVAESARRILVEFLTNRPSMLQEAAVWKRLNLSDRL